MKRTMLALVLAAGACSSALAAFNDPYYMGPLDAPLIGDAPDPIPINNPDGTWTGNWNWPGWTAGLPDPGGLRWDANKFIYFGLENLWLGRDWKKTVTLEFDFAPVAGIPGPGTPELRGQDWGYHPTNYAGGSIGELISETIVPDPLFPAKSHYKLVYTIDPQPDWEWFLLANNWAGVAGGGDIFITDVSLTSFCVPTPAAPALLALGGLISARRRR